MAGAPIFRTMRPGDATECARLHAQAFSPAWSADDFRAQAQRADRVMTAAVSHEPRLSAFAVSRVVGEEGDLLTIVVDRAVQGGGLGAKLLAHHLAALTAARARTVFLEVATDNHAARKLYDRFGFVAVGERKNYYGAASQVRADALVLRCAL